MELFMAVLKPVPILNTGITKAIPCLQTGPWQELWVVSDVKVAP